MFGTVSGSVFLFLSDSCIFFACPLCGVGRVDGACMIKTIQYVAEAASSRVLVALNLKAAFQKVSRRAMPHGIEQSDPDLAAVFSTMILEPQSTGCTTSLPTPRSVLTAVLIRDVHSRLAASPLPLILF